jgi:hypothetical protein
MLVMEQRRTAHGLDCVPPPTPYGATAPLLHSTCDEKKKKKKMHFTAAVLQRMLPRTLFVAVKARGRERGR